MDTIRQLFVEQTTPVEVTLFVFSASAACLMAAVLAYATGMTITWALLLRGRGISLAQVFFPTKNVLATNLGEYLLGAATSLSLFLAALRRHDVVEAVRATPIDSAEVLVRLTPAFPLESVPPPSPTRPRA